MLYDKDILQDLDELLKGRKTSFNIQFFLHLLQSTSRPIGYPNFNAGPNKNYYLNTLEANITKANQLKNGQLLLSAKHSIYQIMICFCYLQQTLGLHDGLSAELVEGLNKAIEQRATTTDEERCAEKSLLKMLLECPKELILLIANYGPDLAYVNQTQILKDNINACGMRHLQQIVNSKGRPAIELIAPTTQVLEVIQSAEQGIKQFCSLELTSSKAKCQTVLGTYLLNRKDKFLSQEEIQAAPFLMSGLMAATKERGKKETRDYIDLRQSEHALFSLFGKHSKATKLSSADKYFKVLNNEKNVVFSKNELDALKSDKDSRLSDIYSRYQAISPVA